MHPDRQTMKKKIFDCALVKQTRRQKLKNAAWQSRTLMSL